jgi:hypothetical protein
MQCIWDLLALRVSSSALWECSLDCHKSCIYVKRLEYLARRIQEYLAGMSHTGLSSLCCVFTKK